ncbi:site-2 protease family protein, partial [bacterium]|nr:site-2 protease family protein [bacterium]
MELSADLTRVLLIIPVFLFSLCFHEFAHGLVAWSLGDPSAKLAGRLTLRPMAHADVLGTLVLPTLCVFSGLPFVGWAKPVPVDVRYFKRPRLG